MPCNPLETAPPDPCADIPDAPEPGEFVPPVGARFRTGRKVPLHLYLHADSDDQTGQPVGVVYHSPELARFVVEAVNADLRLRTFGAVMGSPDLGGAPYPQIVAVYRDTEALLAGRNAGAPELIHADLRRMRMELDRAIRAVEDMADGGDHA